MSWIKKHPYQGALLAIIAILHLPIVFAASGELLRWFHNDDAFYYFKTAQNISEGHGVTFDGVSKTNGFHPLWMFIMVPVFSLARLDLLLPLRLVTIILTLLNMGSAWLLFSLVRRHLRKPVAFLTALAFSLLPATHAVTTKGGLETGLSVFLILLFLYQVQKHRTSPLRLSVIAALTFLARLDNIFLVLLVGGWILILNWNQNSQEDQEDTSLWKTRVQIALAYFAPLGLVILGYMLWNQLAFGTPLPVSGQVKRWWGTLPNAIYGYPPRRFINFVGQFFTDDESIGPWSIVTRPLYNSVESLLGLVSAQITTSLRRLGLLFIAGGGTLALALVALPKRKKIWRAARDFGLLPLFLGCLAQISYYKLSGSVAQRPWYWAPEMLFAVLSGGILLEVVFQHLTDRVRSKRTHVALVYIVIVLLSVLLVKPHLSRVYRVLFQRDAVGESYYLRRADWLRANTQPGDAIGMTGSGTSAYFTPDRRLINLDGLINSYTYFQYMQAGTAHEHLTCLGLDYVFGNAYIVQESDPYREIFERRLEVETVFRDGEKELFLWRFVP